MEKSGCAGNLRTIHMLMQDYLNDHNNAYPTAAGHYSWDDRLAPYDGRYLDNNLINRPPWEDDPKLVNNTEMYRCPADKPYSGKGRARRSYAANEVDPKVGGGLNRNLKGIIVFDNWQKSELERRLGTRIVDIHRPSDAISFMERINADNYIGGRRHQQMHEHTI